PIISIVSGCRRRLRLLYSARWGFEIGDLKTKKIIRRRCNHLCGHRRRRISKKIDT
ncbi:unnamed protein product, partial [Arabidopsis halleri]